MSKTLFLLAAGLAAPILAPQLDGQLLSFRVEDGTSLTTTATRVLTLELSDGEMSMSFDGEEHEAEAPEIELVITEEESLTFSDVFTGVTEGRAAKIKRTFDEIETSSSQHLVNPEGEEMEDETPGTSELTEKTVVFTWDADDESYSCAFDESVEDGDPDLLEELEAIADFSWYLPEGEVEVGDTWEIDVEAFRQTSSLSGELSVVREGDEDDEDTDFGDQFNDNLSGEITGEFLEVREEDGRKLAVLHITSELETSIEQTQEMELEDGGEGSGTETYEFEFELEGDLLWDLDAGHAVSFTLGGDCSMTLTNEQEFIGQGHEIQIRTSQDFEGTVEYKISID